MKTLITLLLTGLLTACSTTSPVTINPDRGTTTTGASGSAAVTEGAKNEGMNASKTGVRPDSTILRRDSLQNR